MRIIYVNDSIAIWGGLERILVEKVNELSKRYGYEIFILTVNQGRHPVPFPLCSEIVHRDLDMSFHRQYQYNGIRRIWIRYKLNRLFYYRLREQINEIRPDIIVSMRWGFVRPLLKIKKSIPLIYEAHTFCSEYSLQNLSIIMKWLYKRNLYAVKSAEMVVSLTEGDAREWKHMNNHVIVIPNIVHLNSSGHYSECQSKSVIYVGRYDRQKDMSSLLSIWEIVHKRYLDWQLHIYGGYGVEQKMLLAKISQMNANIFVHEPTSDILNRYLECSILLLTSLYEPFGLVLPEAMSCGLPVVAFDCPYGPADIITNGVDGFLIKERDVNLYAEKVSLLMDDVNLRRKMGQAGVISSQRYAAERIIPEWKQLFEQMIDKKTS